MKTAVSVIVPCYNVAPYVDECMSGPGGADAGSHGNHLRG